MFHGGNPQLQMHGENLPLKCVPQEIFFSFMTLNKTILWISL